MPTFWERRTQSWMKCSESFNPRTTAYKPGKTFRVIRNLVFVNFLLLLLIYYIITELYTSSSSLSWEAWVRKYWRRLFQSIVQWKQSENNDNMQWLIFNLLWVNWAQQEIIFPSKLTPVSLANISFLPETNNSSTLIYNPNIATKIIN